MPAERWVIHDKEWEKAVIQYKKDWIIMDGSELPPIKYSKNEICYQSLWKKFFDNIAVKNQLNKELQQKHIPKKYWEYLVEKQNFPK